MPLPAPIPIEKHITDATTRGEMNEYVRRNIESLRSQWRVLREQKITAWRKVYRGTPREKYKSFPWKGAANLVPRVVKSFSDQLAARLIMGIYGVDPIFPAGIIGEFAPEENAEEQRQAVETFLSEMGKSPADLNLFEAEDAWFKSATKYGFSVLKHPWEHIVEKVALDGTTSSVFDDFVKYDGPRPLALKFEDFMCPIKAIDFRQANFFVHRITMNEFELRDRKVRGIYPKDKIDAVLAAPDRMGSDPTQQAIENEVTGGTSESGVDKEWDIYECYFPYIFAGSRYQIIATYHLGTGTMLRDVFNFFPENMLPFKLARMGNDGESIIGMGFCELLGVYQEEIAQIHNQRRDSGTLANTTIVRASRSSQLDTNFSLYPMAVLPGEEGEYEFMTVGRPTTDTIKEEQMALQLAQDAAGVGPSSAGSGAGTVNKKGSFSAMGTFAASQEGNTRANLHQTNSRFSHLTLGNDLLKMYAHFGVSPQRLKSMGKQGEMLAKALDNVKSGRLWIPIYAATGSINKEVEKQNKMLMLQHVRLHYQMIQQILGMSQNPMVPPEVLKYSMEVADSSNALMKGLLRDFGYDDPSRVLPDPNGKQILDQKAAQQQQQPPQPNSGAPPIANALPNATPQAAQEIARENIQ